MQEWQKAYYKQMVDNDRGVLLVPDGEHLVALLTYFVGDDDVRFLYEKEPWTVIPDDPGGTTLYIDQLITNDRTHAFIHSEFTGVMRFIKTKHPNITKAKWVRANVSFRRYGLEGEPHVYCKNLK